MRKLKHHEIPRLSVEACRTHPRHPIVVIVDNMRSLHNVGSLFRTADAFLLQELILTGITPTPEHPGLRKTALGAEQTVPWRYLPEASSYLHKLKEQGYTIAALELTNTPTSFDTLTSSSYPLGLIIGNEVHGVSDELLSQADIALEIPQFGTKQSLNASVAFGIAAYELTLRFRTLHQMPLRLTDHP